MVRRADLSRLLAAGLATALVSGACSPVPPGAEAVPEPWASMISSGRATEVLRGIEGMWARGVEPATIGAVRTRGLEAIAAAGSFAVGEETYTVDGLREVAEWLVVQPDVLNLRVELVGDLAPERLLALAVAEGRPHPAPPAGSSGWALPRLDLTAAVGRRDPWVVSAALFLARKQSVDLDADAIMDRWRGPLPWDDECTRQAVLLVAGAPWAAGLLGAAAGHGLPAALAAREPARPGVVEILPWVFRTSQTWAPELGAVDPPVELALTILDSTMEPIGRRAVGGGAPTLELPPTGNFYQLLVVGRGAGGESRFVEGSGGGFVRLAVAVADDR